MSIYKLSIYFNKIIFPLNFFTSFINHLLRNIPNLYLFRMNYYDLEKTNYSTEDF